MVDDEHEPTERHERHGHSADGHDDVGADQRSDAQGKHDAGSKESASDDDEERESSEDDEKPDPAAERKAKRQKIIVIAVLAFLAIAAMLGGLIWWLHARHYENTDDAYIDTKISHVAPQASGVVLRVLVNDNQLVHAGQLLAIIDDSTARTQLAEAEASRAQALSQIAQARSQVGVSAAQLEQAQANTRGPAAQSGKSTRDYQRYARVSADTPAAVSQQQLDEARTTAVNDSAQFVAAQKQVKTNRAQLSSTRTQLESGRAQLQTAEAKIAEAQLQIAHGRVVAPVDGHISNKTVAVGNYAQPGQELMTIVPNQLWVTANFKETQLGHVRVGNAVEIRIDAYPGVSFAGHVDSIQRGAGQSFAVLPAQNATGNFVKVVQRVPVKIVLDHVDAVRFPLGPGMSVTPSVRID